MMRRMMRRRSVRMIVSNPIAMARAQGAEKPHGAQHFAEPLTSPPHPSTHPISYVRADLRPSPSPVTHRLRAAGP